MKHEDCPHEKPTDDDCRQCESYTDTGLFVQDTSEPIMDKLKEYADTPEGKVLQDTLQADQFITFCKLANGLLRAIDRRLVLLDMLGVSVDVYPAVQIGVLMGMMYSTGGVPLELTYRIRDKHEHGDIASEVDKYLEGLCNESSSS